MQTSGITYWKHWTKSIFPARNNITLQWVCRAIILQKSCNLLILLYKKPRRLAFFPNDINRLQSHFILYTRSTIIFPCGATIKNPFGILLSIISSLKLTITRWARVKPWVAFWWCYLVHKNALPASFLHHVIVGRTKEYYSHKRIA